MNPRPPSFPLPSALLALAGALLAGTAVAQIVPEKQTPTASEQHAARTLAALPLRFEENAGQTDSRVRFLTRGPGYTGFLTPQETVLSLRSGSPTPAAPSRRTQLRGKQSAASTHTTVLRTRLLGGNPAPQMEGEQPFTAPATYLKGKERRQWRAATQYARVRARAVYPGIDLVHYGNQEGRLEYDFVVQPGADPQQIRMAVSGAERLAVEAATGDLVLQTEGGEVRQAKPVVYQEREGRREPVAGSFVLAQAGGEVSFAVGEYDRSRPLVIDPTLLYSTYLGGNGVDRARVVAAEGNGIVYVTGYTTSSNFPVSGQYQSNQVDTDAFLTKLDTTKTGAASLLYSTYLGGSSGDGDFPNDVGHSVAVEGNGIVYVAGSTASQDFPMLGQYQGNQASGDAFLTKLDTTKTGVASLLYSTYLGGDNFDTALSVAAEGSGIVYVAGDTISTDFPILGQYQGNSVDDDAFLTKLDTTRTGTTALLYSTYLGGNSYEFAYSVAAEGNGIVYLGGYTGSTDFPLLGQYQTDQGDQDTFLSKLDTKQTGAASLLYSTYLGGDRLDYGYSVAAEGNGIVYIAGETFSSNFPVLRQFQSDQGFGDAFLSKLDTKLSGAASLLYSTYLGGSVGDGAIGVASDENGVVFVGGYTSSTDFPLLNEYQGDQPDVDVFLTTLDTTQTGAASLLDSTYMGGASDDYAYSVAAGGNGLVYIAGQTESGDFPVLRNFQGDQAGYDGFVAVFGVETFQYNLVAQPLGPTQIRIDWIDSTLHETGFKIEMKSSPNGDFVQVATSAATPGTGTSHTYSRTNLSPNSRYSFRVRSYTGAMNGRYSQEAEAITPAAAPPAPENLVVKLFEGPFIRLVWTDRTANEQGFAIERSTNGIQFIHFATVGPRFGVGGYSTYEDQVVSDGVRYHYRVRAIINGVNTIPTNQASALTQMVPVAPSSLSATTIAGPIIRLTWTDNSYNETGFVVDRSINGVNFQIYATTKPLAGVGGSASYEDRGAQRGTRYYYRVRAFNQFSSGYSNTADALAPGS